ncbi:MAG: glutamine amidotransferase [Phycisphaerales bacterium]
MNKILYLGDTALDQAASYLAGILSYSKIDFDYLASDKKFKDSFLKNEYSAIIISDYPAKNFTKNQINRLIAKIQNGTGLLMIGGWESFVGLAGKYEKTALSEVLPVVMGKTDDRVNCFGPCMIVKKNEHAIIKGLPFETKMPAVGGFNKFKVKKGCLEILSTRRYKAQLKSSEIKFSPMQTSPLLVIGSFGKGKTAAFASDVSPHWVGPFVDWGNKRIKAQAEGGNEIEVGNWYVQFFRNIINWISK